MAKKVQVILIDDIDGSEAEETVEFGIDGASYQIDLNTTNAAAIREALEPFVQAGHRVSGSRKRRSAKSAPASDAAQIREWARANGHTVPDRGRIPAAVRDAYNAAH